MFKIHFKCLTCQAVIDLTLKDPAMINPSVLETHFCLGACLLASGIIEVVKNGKQIGKWHVAISKRVWLATTTFKPVEGKA